MPNLPNAKKALRHSKRRQEINAGYKKAIKDLTKKFTKLVTAGQLAEAKTIAISLQQKLDKAAKVGTIKPTAASRKKSKVAKTLNTKK